jgi:hypothetical protein
VSGVSENKTARTIPRGLNPRACVSTKSATQKDRVCERSSRSEVLQMTPGDSGFANAYGVLGHPRSHADASEPVRFSEDHEKLLEREATRKGCQRGPVHPRRHDDPHRVRHGPARRRRFRGGPRSHAAAARCRPSRAGGVAPAGAARRGRRGQGRRPTRRPASTGLFDSDVTPSFGRLARPAARVPNAPVALVRSWTPTASSLGAASASPEP